MGPHNTDATAMKLLVALIAGVLMLAGYADSQADPSNMHVLPSRLTLIASTAAVDKEATRLTREDKFAGAVLIARGGKILLDKAYGFADRDNHVPNTTNTNSA
jgi:D-alanyl-D-alanine carboxypeptidase